MTSTRATTNTHRCCEPPVALMYWCSDDWQYKCAQVYQHWDIALQLGVIWCSHRIVCWADWFIHSNRTVRHVPLTHSPCSYLATVIVEYCLVTNHRMAYHRGLCRFTKNITGPCLDNWRQSWFASGVVVCSIFQQRCSARDAASTWRHMASLLI